jgi:hypothetical protein
VIYLPSFNFSEVELNAQKWRTGFTSYLPLQLRELGFTAANLHIQDWEERRAAARGKLP